MKPSSRAVLSVLGAVLLLGSGAAIYLAVGRGADPARQAGVAPAPLPPAPYELERVYQALASRCARNDLSCFGHALQRVTAEHGPHASLEALRLLQQNGLVSISSDEHQVAHEIGRTTAETFGVNGQAFLLCPSSFNYGCQHGFFEHALGKGTSPGETASLICGPVEADASYSAKFKFYCYHGVGHGVMMAKAYDLQPALGVCDALASDVGKVGCWQGVFMENVNAAIRGEGRRGVFSKDDPLAPCDRLAPQYRRECFINHSGYLMVVFGNSVEKAAAACLGAGEHRSVCLQSLGLLTTNPSWQFTITGRTDPQPNVETALGLCDRFPKDARTDCFTGALDNILNYDGMDLAKRALPFCQRVTGWPARGCYRQIGINVARQVVDSGERRKLCGQLQAPQRDACLAGAGV